MKFLNETLVQYRNRRNSIGRAEFTSWQWERREHASMNLSVIYIYWIIAKKNDKGPQNQEIINKKSKILRYCCKADVSHAEREH